MVLAIAILVTLGSCVSTSSDGNFSVKHRGSVLVGDLTLPGGEGPHPAVMFIHGDGAITADSYGYYKPLMDAFGRAGFATLSWDKPGVARSKGDWLTQSMQDRANEAIAVAKVLKQRTDIDGDAVGLWGVSQAGWVMPLAVSQSSEFAFMISVSAAINWRRQGGYLTRNRLLLEGYKEAKIDTALAFGEKVDTLLASDASYEAYLELVSDAPACCMGAMDRARWHFVSLNINADAIEALRDTRVPVLALFGDKDLNVDTRESASVYERELPRTENSNVTIKVFENADHSLYPSSKDRISGTGIGDAWRVLKVEFLGADAFAPDYINSTVDWAVNWYQGRQPSFQDQKINEL
ncbi:MAG: alpha-beta hydrolase superfamily lysophospholipase [Granulosicoccus sp.]|jgi:alpha-beta hydrolase superfamily lysophospholipase